jgi:hypothetical protein
MVLKSSNDYFSANSHFQVGSENPKVEGQKCSSLPQCPVKGPFPNDKYSKIMQNSQNFHFYPLLLFIFNGTNVYVKGTFPYLRL